VGEGCADAVDPHRPGNVFDLLLAQIPKDASRSENPEHRGRIVKTTGDGLLVEFSSVVDAVRRAVEVQEAMPERNTGIGSDNRMELRLASISAM
jgi:hypothetical protein